MMNPVAKLILFQEGRPVFSTEKNQTKPKPEPRRETVSNMLGGGEYFSFKYNISYILLMQCFGGLVELEVTT